MFTNPKLLYIFKLLKKKNKNNLNSPWLYGEPAMLLSIHTNLSRSTTTQKSSLFLFLSAAYGKQGSIKVAALLAYAYNETTIT